MIILSVFIQACLPRISKKPCRRRLLKAFPGLSRLLCPRGGNERGLMAAARLLRIPLTWPYRRNALRPRVRWGRRRKRPVCGTVSASYRQGGAGRHPWHHLRNHSSPKLIAVTCVQGQPPYPLPPSACRTPGVVPVWKAKCFLIKRQSKNKPLFGSLSCVYGAANPHLLPEVKTVWGSCVGSACTEVKEVGEAKFSGPISSKHSITNAPFLPPCMFPCFHCVLFAHVCNCASGRNACLNCLNAWVRLLQRLFQHKYLENRLELYSRLPRISLVPWSVRQSAHCAPLKQFRGEVRWGCCSGGGGDS